MELGKRPMFQNRWTMDRQKARYKSWIKARARPIVFMILDCWVRLG